MSRFVSRLFYSLLNYINLLKLCLMKIIFFKLMIAGHIIQNILKSKFVNYKIHY